MKRKSQIKISMSFENLEGWWHCIHISCDHWASSNSHFSCSVNAYTEAFHAWTPTSHGREILSYIHVLMKITHGKWPVLKGPLFSELCDRTYFLVAVRNIPASLDMHTPGFCHHVCFQGGLCRVWTPDLCHSRALPGGLCWHWCLWALTCS